MSDENSAKKKDLNLGRKIFFLDPPYNFVKNNLATLRMLEYEVYIVADYKNMKTILSLSPDSILYIYVDTILSRRAWLNFIISIQHTPELAATKIGIFTKGLTDSQQDDFLKNAKIECGLILLQGADDAITGAFIEQLNENNAKGVRKYVRAECSHIKAAQLFIEIDGKMTTLQCMDISSVGCAVQVPKGFPGHLEKNMLIRDASLQLHHGIHVDLLCFATSQGTEFDTAVFLFVQASANAKNAIREYIHILLQKALNESIEKANPDNMNYNLPLSKILEYHEKPKDEKEGEKKEGEKKDGESKEELKEEGQEENSQVSPKSDGKKEEESEAAEKDGSAKNDAAPDTDNEKAN